MRGRGRGGEGGGVEGVGVGEELESGRCSTVRGYGKGVVAW